MKEDDLSRFAPLLSSIEKKDIYQVPEGTFDELPFAIQKSISGKNTVGLLSLTDKIFRAASISFTAAFIAGIIFISYCSFISPPPSDGTCAEYAGASQQGEENHPQGFYHISTYLAFE